MNRREFITFLGGAAAVWPRAARAQQPGRTYHIGVMTRSPRMAVNYVAFFDELRRLGFVEGQNLAVDARGFAARSEQFPELAAALVSSGVDALVCRGDAAIRAAQHATQTIPIVGITDDMVGSGLVRSLAKPGGNTTGVSILATELDGKRMEILIEMVPNGRRMAALADASATAPVQLQTLQDAARARGVHLSVRQVAKSEEVIGAIEEVKASGAAALNVLATPLLNAFRQIIIERAAALRLPAIYQWPETAKCSTNLLPRRVERFQKLHHMRPSKQRIFRGRSPNRNERIGRLVWLMTRAKLQANATYRRSVIGIIYRSTDVHCCRSRVAK